MAEASRINEIAHERGVALDAARRAAIERALAGGSAAWFHGRDADPAPLLDVLHRLLPGPVLVFRAGVKPGAGLKALQEAQFAQPEGPLAAAPAQVKDAAFVARVREAKPALIVLAPAEQALENLRALPDGMAHFHALYDAVGRPPLVFTSTRASQSLLADAAARLDLAPPEALFLDYFRDNVMFEVLAAPPGERKAQLAARIAAELPAPGVFYTSGAKPAKELRAALAEAAIDAALAHAQQRASDRALAVDDFVKGRVRALVTAGYPGDAAARAARYCVHYDLPPGLETYYFEAAATGAPDKPARAVLLFERADYGLLGAKAEAKEPVPAEAAALLTLLRESGAELPLATWAEAAGLAAKKARTLAALLKEGGFVSEAGGVYRLVAGADLKAAAAAVAEYRARRDAERRGFQDVVAYAESGLCRVRMLMRFFGQGDVEPCGLCDNCRKGKEQRVRAASRKHAQTPHQPGRWARGDVVRHAAWGEGEVKQVWGDKLRVHFPGRGEKVVKAEYVEPPEA